MGSPVPDAIKHKLVPINEDGSPPSKEQVGELYKVSYRKFIENFAVQNSKVRYYCNKTVVMRQPLHAIIDDLILVQKNAMAYLDQLPQESDHYLLAMIFEMIHKVTNAIDWKAMNNKCYWKDFERETRQLRLLIGQAEVINTECCHSVTNKANRAIEILEDFKVETKSPIQPKKKFNKRGEETMNEEWDIYQDKLKDCPLGFSGIQHPGPPLENEIKIVCTTNLNQEESSYKEDVVLQWVDHDTLKMQTTKLLDTSDSFRLRLHRSLIYCAHKSLQTVILTMARIEVTVRTEFSLDKLAKCDGLNESELLPHERLLLKKSKKEFDELWDSIMIAVNRFRIQFMQLRKYDKVLKRLVKNPKYAIKIEPDMKQINVKICEQLLLRFATEAEPDELLGIVLRNKMYQDRTTDVITMIQDMWWTIDKTSFKTMDVLIMLLYTALTQVCFVLNAEDRIVVRDRLDAIFQQRDKVKRYLKKSVKVFGHSAFQDLPTIHKAKRFKSFTAVRSSKIIDDMEQSAQNVISESVSEGDDEDEEGNDDKLSSTVIHLPGAFKVNIGEQKEFFVSNLFKDRTLFPLMTEEDQVIVMKKMLGRLYHFVTSEACLSKNVFARSTETKSLMKRLEPKDRINENLIKHLTNGLSHIKNMLRLMNAMNALLTFAKKT